MGMGMDMDMGPALCSLTRRPVVCDSGECTVVCTCGRESESAAKQKHALRQGRVSSTKTIPEEGPMGAALTSYASPPSLRCNTQTQGQRRKQQPGEWQCVDSPLRDDGEFGL